MIVLLNYNKEYYPVINWNNKYFNINSQFICYLIELSESTNNKNNNLLDNNLLDDNLLDNNLFDVTYFNDQDHFEDSDKFTKVKNKKSRKNDDHNKINNQYINKK